MIFKRNKKILYILVVLFLVLSPALVSASGHTGDEPGETNKLDNPIGADSIEEFITAILDIIVKLGAPIVVFFIIYAGFLFVTAQGKPDKLQKAKDTFLYTVIGAAILLGAFAISEIIKNTVEEIQGGPLGQADAKVNFEDLDRFYDGE